VHPCDPASEQAVVTIRSTTTQHVTLSVMDGSGRLLRQLYSGSITAGNALVIPFETAGLDGAPDLVRLRLEGDGAGLVRGAVIIR
jgi:hypothetical protein